MSLFGAGPVFAGSLLAEPVDSLDFDSVDFDSPAGFASFALKAVNPSRAGWLPDPELAEISTALGSPLRQVAAHY